MRISSDSYGGGVNVNDPAGLALALRTMAITFAARAAAGVDDFTADNSGGTAGATLADIPTPSHSAQDGTNAVAKTEAETSFGQVVDGLAEIIAQANLVRAEMPEVFAALVDNTGGSAADGTIAAIDDSATGVDSAMCASAGARTVVAALRSAVAQAGYYVNKLCVATGQTALVDGITSNAAADAEWGVTFAAISTDTGTAADGSAADAANGIYTKAEFDVAVGAMADAIASMAAKLDAITADANATAACGVVAA